MDFGVPGSFRLFVLRRRPFCKSCLHHILGHGDLGSNFTSGTSSLIASTAEAFAAVISQCYLRVHFLDACRGMNQRCMRRPKVPNTKRHRCAKKPSVFVRLVLPSIIRSVQCAHPRFSVPTSASNTQSDLKYIFLRFKVRLPLICSICRVSGQ